MVGLPDERFGQKIVAVVSTVSNKVLKEEELIEDTRSIIAAYKLPKSVILQMKVQRAPNGKANYKWAKSFAEEHLS